MTANYILLERIELNASATSVTFSNIPQTGYTDLKIVASARSTRSNYADNFGIRFNGDTGGNYSYRRLYGLGSGTPGSTNQSSVTTIVGGTLSADTATASTFGNAEFYIPNYTSSAYKSVSNDGVSENNATDAEADLIAGIWNSTSAITSVTLYALSGNLVSGSTFSLYGIAAVGTTPAIAPKADGGNVIATDGTYWYHTFLTSGTFTPQVGLSCDYLVVAGGGGGGGSNSVSVGGAGGGAGGYLSSTLGVSASTNYTVTIGAGGAGGGTTVGSGPGAIGTAGSNSVFASITSTGGGYGGAYSNTGGQNGGAGGSGGGAAYIGTAGAASPSGQGYAGGTSSGDGGAGGGGSAAVGSNTANANGGAGGAGTATSISGSSVTYAGGGGGGSYGATGGAGGTGGGGAGGNGGAVGTNGTANLGGGGGGKGNTSSGNAGNGGSGIVIIRYAV